MPTKLGKRRGVARYRTVRAKGGYAHVAVTKKGGPRGGRTIIGSVHKYKRKRNAICTGIVKMWGSPKE